MRPFFVYMLRCSDGSYYIGHTDDLEKRISEHNLGHYTSYTTTRLPVELVYSEAIGTREEAIAAEFQIKGWTRAKKEALIKSDWKTISMLSKKKFIK